MTKCIIFVLLKTCDYDQLRSSCHTSIQPFVCTSTEIWQLSANQYADKTRITNVYIAGAPGREAFPSSEPMYAMMFLRCPTTIRCCLNDEGIHAVIERWRSSLHDGEDHIGTVCPSGYRMTVTSFEQRKVKKVVNLQTLCKTISSVSYQVSVKSPSCFFLPSLFALSCVLFSVSLLYHSFVSFFFFSQFCFSLFLDLLFSFFPRSR